MPIYAYRCESCGFEKDALQKMSDAPLTRCPQCGKDTFVKQVTAAGFQLKGSGWYVTDFRGGNNGAPAAKKDGGEKSEAKADGAAESGKSADSGSKSDGAASPSAEGAKSASAAGTASTASGSSTPPPAAAFASKPAASAGKD
jgi:putative FmdB family regulatory protein